MTTSLQFAGNATSYIRVPSNSQLELTPSNDLTIEWYQYQTDNNLFPTVFVLSSVINSFYLYKLANILTFEILYGLEFSQTINFSNFKNKWVHVAFSVTLDTVRIFIDGIKIIEQVEPNFMNINSPNELIIGNGISGRIDNSQVILGISNDGGFGGYIYGFQWIVGVGKYTSNFTVPTSYTIDANTVLFLTGDQSLGTIGSTIIKNNVLSSPLVPPGFETIQQSPIEYIQAQRRPVLSNNLIFYKPDSLAACGVGTARNSRIKSRRT